MHSSLTFYYFTVFIFNSLIINHECFVDAESGAALSNVEPQSHGGCAADPAGPTDSGFRGSRPHTCVSKNRLYNSACRDCWIYWTAFHKWCSIPCCRAGLGNTEASVNIAPELASDSVLNSQSGNGPQVATETEQQQQFVQQMLQALANTNNGVPPPFLIITLFQVLQRIWTVFFFFHK